MGGGYEDSFDRTAKEDSRSADLLSFAKMTMEGAFTRVICLIADWPIPPMPFKIRLRWESCPVAQSSQFTNLVRVHSKEVHPYEVALCGLADEK